MMLKEPHPSRSGGRLLFRTILAAACVLLAVGGAVFADWWSAVPDSVQPHYVGRQTCASCHQHEHQKFQGSHHDLAMDVAAPDTVLADFDDAELEHYGVVSRMFRRDGKYFIHTEGPDGTMQDFEVKYVFGVDPLQQYMVEFDRPAEMPAHEVARLQVLRVSWDTRQKKWFHLDPPDVHEKLSPEDDLHWTGVAQRWNNMCADCHSTNVRKGFDSSQGVYHTTFNEIDVSCEACHGPGSLHVELANARSLFWDRRRGYGLAKLKGEANDPEIESCAQCHSRRRVLREGYQPGLPFHDFFTTELMSSQLYHCDGQILDEVYVHGSFLQSKMYHKGIRCTDCHDPHTARLKHDGNQVCTSCHQHTAAKYDSPSHHRHQAGSSGASCVECHMPETTYMDVDPRRDHSLRTPRPDLSVAYGAPNACTRCHLQLQRDEELAKVDESVRSELRQYNDWMRLARPVDGVPNESVAAVLRRLDARMAQAFSDWYGDQPREEHWGQAMAATWAARPEASELWRPWLERRATPAIVRASALMNESTRGGQDVLEHASRLLKDPHEMVRAAAVSCFENLIPTRLEEPALDENEQAIEAVARQLQSLVDQLLPLLQDESAQVRMETARVLARTPPAVLPLITRGPDRDALRRATTELVESVLVHDDRAGGLAMVASLREMSGDDDAAEARYKEAIEREPLLAGPRTNLAALYDRLAEQADRRARQAAAQRNQASLEFYAKIVAERSQQARQLRSEELPLLARDAALAPENAMVQHRYGLSLYLNGDLEQAAEHLLQAHQMAPENERFLLMIVLLYQRMNEKEKALPLAEELARRNPAHQALLQEIRNAP